MTTRFFSGTTATLYYDALDHFTEWNAGSTNYEWRYYDPKVGVFLSADSAQGNMQGMNPYGYVGATRRR